MLSQKSKTKSKKIKKGFKSKTKNLKKRKLLKKPTKLNRYKYRSKIIIKSSKNDIIQKFSSNPIIKPLSSNNWENWQTFNPGVILVDDKIHFVYRAIGKDGISRLGYASSNDGFFINERLNYPIYEHKVGSINYWSFLSGGSLGGAEDPRLIKIKNEDDIYMLYTACDNGLRVGLTSIKINDFLNKNWKWKNPRLISPPNEVHKNWVLFPEKINGRYVLLHSLVPRIQVTYLDSLNFKSGEYVKSYYDLNYRNENSWDWWIRGIGPPPLKTKLGWLIFYHAMEKGQLNKYKVGAMILESNNPQNIILKLNHPILEPEKYYENNGFKSGVVYLTGAIIKDENLMLYYGSADNYVSIAFCNLNKFLDWLQKNSQKIFQAQPLKIKKNN